MVNLDAASQSMMTIAHCSPGKKLFKGYFTVAGTETGNVVTDQIKQRYVDRNSASQTQSSDTLWGTEFKWFHRAVVDPMV